MSYNIFFKISRNRYCFLDDFPSMERKNRHHILLKTHNSSWRDEKIEGKAITVSLTHEVTVCKNSLRYIIYRQIRSGLMFDSSSRRLRQKFYVEKIPQNWDLFIIFLLLKNLGSFLRGYRLARGPQITDLKKIIIFVHPL